MRSKDITIRGVIDRKFDGVKEIAGIPIIAESGILSELQIADSVLILTTRYMDDIIVSALEKYKVPKEKLCSWNRVEKCINSIQDVYADIYAKESYSQFGEDIFLKNYFSDLNSGTYVDVGAHHPFRYSNTYWAYRNNWHGINIEPNVNLIKLFELYRPNDLNINCGISDEVGRLEYYKFDSPELNSFDANRIEHCIHHGYRFIGTEDVPVRPLSEILDEYGIKKIDFISIDTEGFDLQVIKSIDFGVDIQLLVVEQDVTLEDLPKTDVYKFLKEKGYRVIAQYNISVFYEKVEYEHI